MLIKLRKFILQMETQSNISSQVMPLLSLSTPTGSSTLRTTTLLHVSRGCSASTGSTGKETLPERSPLWRWRFSRSWRGTSPASCRRRSSSSRSLLWTQWGEGLTMSRRLLLLVGLKLMFLRSGDAGVSLWSVRIIFNIHDQISLKCVPDFH